jgi:N-acetyl sugar amidotransferase
LAEERERQDMTDDQKSVVRRCSRCILPESYPDIDFDENGVCRVCREHDRKYSNIDWDERRARLEHILDRYRGKGEKYDVLVPFSGGKDSTYTLWMLKNRYDMRCLAFNFDNGFQDPNALAFVKKAAQRLGVSLFTYMPNFELLREVYSTAMEKVGEFCAACVVLMPTAIFRAADMHGIRLIAAGFSDMLEAPPPETSYMDRKCFWNIMKSDFTKKQLRWNYFFPSFKRMFTVKQINLPDFVPWDLPVIYETLNRELDFGKSMADVRYDCLATPHSSYIFRLRTGFGKYEYLYANMVRSGVIDREEALKIVSEREPDEPPEGFDEFLAGLGLDRGVLDGIESRSVFDFGTRKRGLRDIAIRIREALP